jgi:hypothetical protein
LSGAPRLPESHVIISLSEHALENSFVISPPCFDELGTGATKDVLLVASLAEFSSTAQRNNQIPKM